MPSTPEPEGTEETLNITQICETYGISRTLLHSHRAGGDFPAPVTEPGSTRLRWRKGDLDSYFEANPKRQGKRTDLKPSGDDA